MIAGDREEISGSVRRRRAFYIHGFDPRSARFYHTFYRDQAALYTARFGTPIAVGPLEGAGERDAEWRIDAEMDGASVTTDYTFLNWGDLASGHLKSGFWRILADGVWTFAEMIRTGHLRQIWRADRGSALLIVYAHAMIAVYPLAAIALGYGVGAAAE